MIKIPLILQVGLLVWGVLLFVVMLFLGLRIVWKTRAENIGKENHSILINELTKYLSTGEVSKLLLTFKTKPKYTGNTLLGLLEKFSGVDYENLKAIVEKLNIRPWIIANLKKKNPRKVQPALLLAKHLNDPRFTPLIKRHWRSRNTITRLLAKKISVMISGITEIEYVLDTLPEESLNARRFLVESISYYTKAAPHIILKKLNSTDDAELQIPLVEGLKNLFVTDAIKPLLKLLQETTNEALQFQILSFFSVVSTGVPKKLLDDFWGHSSEKIRKAALVAFLSQEIDLHVIASILTRAMKDKSWFIRYYALHRWVSYFGDVKPPLLEEHLYERVLAEEKLELKCFGVGTESL